MDTLVHSYAAPPSDFHLNCCSKAAVFPEENHVFRQILDPGLDGFPVSVDEYLSDGGISSDGSSPVETFNPTVESSTGVESFQETENSDVMLKFISQMLMEEEDLENKPYMLHDCLALQATEKSLFDVLNNNLEEDSQSPDDHFTKYCCFPESNSSPSNLGDDHQSCFIPYSEVQYPFLPTLQPDLQSSGSSTGTSDGVYSHEGPSVVPYSASNSPYISREKKNRNREDRDFRDEHRNNKQVASDGGEPVPQEMYDMVLLCPSSAPGEADKKRQQKEQPKGSNRGRPKGGKKQGVIKEVVDMRSLLMQCTQAVASYDSRNVNDLLMRIRQHSSPQGDGTERLAHYFANALEARLAGTGTASYAALSSTRTSAADILKAYKIFITACPFMKMSYMFANRTIKKLSEGATTLHIIDFGILYGFQWPCLIQALSERPGGPPKLRLTGIDFPQPGFRPAERVADTGRRLANYCERFGVPFEYIPIAQKWETIKLEDLKIEKNELVVVNSVYRLHNVLDETVTAANSPRDAVLSLIKKINPRLFIHGLINGTHNTPFFVTRLREAVFHFSSMFDMFEATTPREDQNRVLFEEEIFGRDIMNIIACEGTERIERPETYKQWQVRNLRAGFRQLPLDQEILKFVRNKVRTDYHKDFSVDEDGHWMLQGWKGRVMHAISYWQSAHK